MGFGVGEILRTALRVAVKRFLPFFAIGLVYFSPVLILAFFLEDIWFDNSGVWLWILSALLYPVCFLAMAGPIAAGVVHELDGASFSLTACVARGGLQLRSVLGVAAVLVLVYILASIAAGWIPFFLGELLSLSVFASVAIRWAVAVPASVVERRGTMASLTRSAALTGGHRWALLALGLLLFLVPPLLVGFISGLVRGGPADEVSFLAWQIIGTLLLVGLGVFHAAVQAVTYHRLQLEKNGLSPDTLARVFE